MIAQFENAFVSNVVDDIWPFLAASQNASACQALKMSRNIGLGESRRFHEPVTFFSPSSNARINFNRLASLKTRNRAATNSSASGVMPRSFALRRIEKITAAFHFPIDYMRICSYCQL